MKSTKHPIIDRAIKESITDIGQLSLGEKKALNKTAKAGILKKNLGGPYPNLKFVYAKLSFDFIGERIKAIHKILHADS